MVSAFLIGTLSALSLPLGAVTARYWQPRARMTAFLMAFGAGALLAALSVDLVAKAMGRGEYLPMAAGCLLGGLLFVLLNQIINHHGGFLRKSSTMINYLQRLRQLHFQQALSRMKRLPIFADLTKQEGELLVTKAVTRSYPAGSTLFRRDDPGDRIYIIDEGEIELRDPDQPESKGQVLRKGEAFGWMSMLTGSTHRTVAQTMTDVRLWVWSREDFNACLHQCPLLAEHLCAFLTGPEIHCYLQEHQGLSPDAARAWTTTAGRIIREEGALPQARPLDKDEEEFKLILHQVKRLPIFAQLDPPDLERIARRVILKKYDKGHTFFHQNEYADRMYIVHHGEVALIDPQHARRTLLEIHPLEAFGCKSFLAGASHSVSAIGQEATAVWELLRRDFVELLKESPALRDSVQDYISRQDMKEYLADKQHLDPRHQADWERQAAANIRSGEFVPSAADMAPHHAEQKGAPLAIWLGILLDAIPESLVIGSSMNHGMVSLSLFAGVFLSNFPEALSSSVGMREQKISFSRILGMWTTIMLVTGAGAAAGRLLFMNAPTALFSFIQGLAAGSMLTMIAETMLPEAYIKGGVIVGISTLAGFLAALFFSTLGGGAIH